MFKHFDRNFLSPENVSTFCSRDQTDVFFLIMLRLFQINASRTSVFDFTRVSRDFFKISVCHEIRTRVSDLRTSGLTDCTTAVHDKCIAYTCIYSMTYSIA